MGSKMLDEIRFRAQVLTDAERTVICSPELESRCKGYVDARGLSGLIHVQASPVVPDDTILVIDHNAIEAGLRAAVGHTKPRPTR